MHCDECPECQGMGMRIVAGGAAACVCVQRRKLEQAINRTGVPKRYADATFDNFQLAGTDKSVGAALMMARRYVSDWTPVNANNGLLLVGPVGTGKTHLAAAILRELVMKGAHGTFVDFRELLKAVQSTYSSGSTRTEAEVLAPVIQADVLVLDELGAMRPTEWVADAIEHVLNARYNSDRATILTTNYVMRGPGGTIHEVGGSATGYERRPAAREETLGDRIGARMFSRLSEMCRAVPMAGSDFRMRGARTQLAR